MLNEISDSPMAINGSIQGLIIPSPVDKQLGAVAPHEHLGGQEVKELLELPGKLLLNSSYLYDVNPECGIALAARKPNQSYPHLNAIYVIAMITLLGNLMMFLLICSKKKSRNQVRISNMLCELSLGLFCPFQRGNTFMMAIGVCDVFFMIYFCSANLFFSKIIHQKYISIFPHNCFLDFQ